MALCIEHIQLHRTAAHWLQSHAFPPTAWLATLAAAGAPCSRAAESNKAPMCIRDTRGKNKEDVEYRVMDIKGAEDEWKEREIKGDR